MSFEVRLKQLMLYNTIGILRTPVLLALITDQGVEVSAPSYSRKVMRISVTAEEPVQATNTAQIDWGNPTESWGKVAEVWIYDPNGIFIYAKKELLTPQVIAPGAPFTLPARTLEIGFV